jgi:hypothetical protein
MKWGVRKARVTSADYNKSAPLRKKHASELSDDELKSAIGRMSLESQFKNLKQGDISRGQKLVTELGSNFMKQQLAVGLTAGAAIVAKLIKDAVEKKIKG